MFSMHCEMRVYRQQSECERSSYAGCTESALMSRLPVVRYIYDYKPAPSSLKRS